MIYLDTSVMVALISNEASAARIAEWFSAHSEPTISGDWCKVEFASALALKQRTGQINSDESAAAWAMFGEFCAASLRLLPLATEVFDDATALIRQSNHALRAGDALHLALALHVKAPTFFTLDVRLAASAGQFGLRLVDLDCELGI